MVQFISEKVKLKKLKIVRMVACELCGEKFRTNSELRYHSLETCCDECEGTWECEKEFNIHKFREHDNDDEKDKNGEAKVKPNNRSTKKDESITSVIRV